MSLFFADAFLDGNELTPQRNCIWDRPFLARIQEGSTGLLLHSRDRVAFGCSE